MSDVSQETINRALLGDCASIQICIDAKRILPCPVCGSAGKYFGIVECTGNTVEGRPCTHGNMGNRFDTDGWNKSRPDLRTAAIVLYAPRWIPCAERLPEPSTPVTVHAKIDDEWFVGYGYLRKPPGNRPSEWYTTVTETRSCNRFMCPGEVSHWSPLIPPPVLTTAADEAAQ